MKKLVILLSILTLAVVSMGALVSLDPWVMPMGRISFSAGNPTWAVRYGLFDFVEAGAAMKEQGGYMKFGFGNENFGAGFGIGTAFMFTNVFGAIGFKSGGLEIDAGGRLVQEPNSYDLREEQNPKLSMTFEGEVSYLFSREGNSKNRAGLYGIYISKDLKGTFAEFQSGAYISAMYRDVFFMPYVRLSGGIMFRYDGKPIVLYRNFGILIDITAYFDIFKK